jgi:hypothetical protein
MHRTSRQMLSVMYKLQKYKSSNTTWSNVALCVAALTTTLFTQWNRRGEKSVADLAALKDDVRGQSLNSSKVWFKYYY